MAMLNIPSSVVDPAYRYKMPRIISKQESRGTGRKTGILNMGEVAGALKLDPVYLTKFFGYELCAEASYSNKAKEGERVVIRGHHEPAAFQAVVDKFIEKYVLCPNCTLPEIDMVVKKGLVGAACKACGWHGELDNGHRLANYIAKNPPGTGAGFDVATGKKPKDERRKEHAAKVGKNQDEDDETASYQSEWEEAERKSKGGQDKDKKVRKERKDKKEKTVKADKIKGQDGVSEHVHQAENIQLKTEKKCDKVKKGKKETKDKKERTAQVEKLDADSEEEEELKYDDKVIAGVIKHIADFVKSNPGTAKERLFEEVRVQQVTKGFDHKIRLYVVVSSLFPEGCLSADGIKHHSPHLKEFRKNANMPFVDWIWGFEVYLAANPAATKAWAPALKALYDEDLVEEEQILEYYKAEHNNPGFEASKKAVAPFLEWLETAEESEDEADSNDDSD